MDLDQAIQRAETAQAQAQRPARRRPTYEDRRQHAANEAAATLVMLLECEPKRDSPIGAEVRAIRRLEWLATLGTRPIASEVDELVERWERQMVKAELKETASV